MELFPSHLTSCGLWHYHCRGFKPHWDVAEAGCCAVLPGPVVLVPVTAATGHCYSHGNTGQEDEKEEEVPHLHWDSQRLSVCLSLREEMEKVKEEMPGRTGSEHFLCTCVFWLTAAEAGSVITVQLTDCVCLTLQPHGMCVSIFSCLLDSFLFECFT